MKPERQYKVYVIDSDGSERLGGIVDAKSLGHAKSVAKKMGMKKVHDAVLVD